MKDATVGAISNSATITIPSSSSFSPQQFKEMDIIRVKGEEDLGKGVVRWVGSLPGIDEPVAGIEMVCIDYLTFTDITFLKWVLFIWLQAEV